MVGAESAGDLAALGDGIGQDGPCGTPLLGEHHGEQTHDAASDDEHGGGARHLEHLEPGQTARGRLRQGCGGGIERLGQLLHGRARQHHALGKATGTRDARAMTHSPLAALRALAATVVRLTHHRAPDEAATHAASDLGDHSGVFVAHDERRLPGEQALGGVDVGAADAGGVDGHEHLPRRGRGLGHLVDREAVLTLPGRDFHHGARSSPMSLTVTGSQRRDQARGPR